MSDQPKAWLFWLLTTIYISAAISVCIAHPGFIDELGANEWGDFLSGMFSPLAFLWLLYAALAQKEELKLQRNEIKENNETQKKQQEQLERQANALDAQVARLEAQATAAFQPVFYLDTSADAGGRLQLHLKNLGASVLDVSGVDGVEIQSLIRPSGGWHANLRGGVCAYWEKDWTIVVLLPADPVGTANITNEQRFRIQVTRLDLVRLVFSMRYISAEQRVVVEVIERQVTRVSA